MIETGLGVINTQNSQIPENKCFQSNENLESQFLLSISKGKRRRGAISWED